MSLTGLWAYRSWGKDVLCYVPSSEDNGRNIVDVKRMWVEWIVVQMSRRMNEKINQWIHLQLSYYKLNVLFGAT